MLSQSGYLTVSVDCESEKSKGSMFVHSPVRKRVFLADSVEERLSVEVFPTVPSVDRRPVHSVESVCERPVISG